MSVNQFGGIALMMNWYAEVPPPVPSLLWAGLPPTGPARITVSAGPMTSIVFANISTTTSPFRLLGGTYGMTATAAAWASGSVTLQILAADQLTWVTALTAFTANSFATVTVPNGIYRLLVASVANAYVSIQIVV
jgi:hypothetical protein